MKKIYKRVSKPLGYIVAVMFAFTIFSCASSQYSTNRETDGIYYNPKTDASSQQYSSNEIYKEDGTIKVGGVYFDNKGDGPEEFYYEDTPTTNTAQTSASPVIVNTNRNVYVLETSAYQNNPSWGKQTGVDIVVNNWGGYGYGGYPYWGWNSWYGPGRAWYGGHHGWGYYGGGPYWSLGWNSWYGTNWGMGYYGGYYGGYWGNSWYYDRPYYNDYYYGRRAYSRYSPGTSINTGRQPSYGGREIRPNTSTREVRPSTSIGTTQPTREVRPSTSVSTERPTREVRPSTSVSTERPTREVRPSTSISTERPTREVRPSTSVGTTQSTREVRPVRTTTPSVNTQRSSQSGSMRSNDNYSTPSRTPSYSSPSRSSSGSIRSSGSVSPSRSSSGAGSSGGARRR